MDNEPQQPEVQPNQQPVNLDQAPSEIQPGQQVQPPAQDPFMAQPQSALPTPEPAKPKKSHKGTLFAIIGVLLIGIGLAGGWYVFDRDTKSPKSTTTNIITKTTTPKATGVILKPSEIITKIKTETAKSYTLIDNTSGVQLKTGQVSFLLGEYAPVYKASGYTFYTTASGGSGISLASYYVPGGTLPSPTDIAIRTAVIKIYTELGLVKSATYGDSESSSLTDVYTGKGVVCTVDATATPVNPTTASCGLLSAYAAAAAKAKPLADVFPNITATTVISNVRISDSQTDGYQSARTSIGDVMGMGGYAGLFYKNTSGVWKYFKGTQEIIPCSDFNTTDIKNAFMGEACWDEATNKESVVQ